MCGGGGQGGRERESSWILTSRQLWTLCVVLLKTKTDKVRQTDWEGGRDKDRDAERERDRDRDRRRDRQRGEREREMADLVVGQGRLQFISTI